MGSVGRDYKCPWCGRVGNGGYAPDSVGYPLCTGGTHSCLWYQVVDQSLTTLQEVRQRALEVVLTIRRPHQLTALSYSLEVEYILEVEPQGWNALPKRVVHNISNFL